MRGISRKFAIWFSVLTLLVLVFGLVVPDFVIFMSNTRKVEKKLENLAPAYRIFREKQKEYMEVLKAIESTPDFDGMVGNGEISVIEVETLLRNLISTRKVTVKQMVIDANEVIPVDFLGLSISQPKVKISLDVEEVKR
ncbi:hypothetical protein TRQ7_04520 [Thermotoga sp. RQ7]|uniref:hypothetical protein n=1 Tax=Thermotoga sp. RQ7 TaxID=126738 RepID=UPI0005A31E3D|nr:hypothetical protein [Thermotoga sp. RQ7]AJG40719.1 hypothetical protein TRQ7_04520 [Thermotoga sp. RQ7]